MDNARNSIARVRANSAVPLPQDISVNQKSHMHLTQLYSAAGMASLASRVRNAPPVATSTLVALATEEKADAAT